jgi:hypothetical protein
MVPFLIADHKLSYIPTVFTEKQACTCVPHSLYKTTTVVTYSHCQPYNVHSYIPQVTVCRLNA